MKTMIARVRRKAIKGSMTIPGSKSHTIRAIVIATLAGGKSVILNPLPSDDCLSAVSAARLFGASIVTEADRWVVESPAGGIRVPDNVVDVGNSGTTLYFMTSMASLLPGYTVFTGDASIRRRPSTPLLDALTQLGAFATTTRPGSKSAPHIVRGPIKSGVVKVEGNPSQYISSLMLAAPMCDGMMTIECDNPAETPYIDMTADWMRRTGITVDYDDKTYRYFKIAGKQSYTPFTRTIPADWSSVAFPLAAALGDGSEIVVENMDFSDKQGDSAIVDHLANMGAAIEKDTASGVLRLKGGAPLTAIEADMANTPDMLPIMCVVACLAKGTTVLRNVAGARKKETDRVAVTTELLRKMGADISATDNEIRVNGGRQLTGCPVESYGDHRIAMAMTVAGLHASGETTVNEAQCASVTFPGFYDKLNNLGAGIQLIEAE